MLKQELKEGYIVETRLGTKRKIKIVEDIIYGIIEEYDNSINITEEYDEELKNLDMLFDSYDYDIVKVYNKNNKLLWQRHPELLYPQKNLLNSLQSHGYRKVVKDGNRLILLKKKEILSTNSESLNIGSHFDRLEELKVYDINDLTMTEIEQRNVDKALKDLLDYIKK